MLYTICHIFAIINLFVYFNWYIGEVNKYKASHFLRDSRFLIDGELKIIIKLKRIYLTYLYIRAYIIFFFFFIFSYSALSLHSIVSFTIVSIYRPHTYLSTRLLLIYITLWRHARWRGNRPAGGLQPRRTQSIVFIGHRREYDKSRLRFGG